jgi:hypothetical protein
MAVNNAMTQPSWLRLSNALKRRPARLAKRMREIQRGEAGIGKGNRTLSLMPITLLKGPLGPGTWRRMASVVSGQLDGRQPDAVAASRTVIIVALQCHEGDARLRTALGTVHKCFTTWHACISFPPAGPSTARETLFLPRRNHPIRQGFPWRVRNNGLDFQTPRCNIRIKFCTT